MTLSRRLAAGLPTVGIAAFAAVAFAGGPASATITADPAGRPAVMAMPSCASESRTNCGYAPGTPGGGGYGSGGGNGSGYGNGPSSGSGSGSGSGAPVMPGAVTGPGGAGGPGSAGGAGGPHRGQPGYTPPTGVVNTVPPPATLPPPTSVLHTGGTAHVRKHHQGVSAGTLPRTGTPVGPMVAFAGMLLAAGTAAVFFSRRRRSA